MGSVNSNNEEAGFESFMRKIGFQKVEKSSDIVSQAIEAFRASVRAPATVSIPTPVSEPVQEDECQGCTGCDDAEEGPFSDIEIDDFGNENDVGSITISAQGTSSHEFIEHLEWLASELSKEYGLQSSSFESVISLTKNKKFNS